MPWILGRTASPLTQSEPFASAGRFTRGALLQASLPAALAMIMSFGCGSEGTAVTSGPPTSDGSGGAVSASASSGGSPTAGPNSSSATGAGTGGSPTVGGSTSTATGAGGSQVGVWTPMLDWPLATKLISGEGVLVDPVRPSDFYFFYEADHPNAGGARHVLKSTDYGATWSQIDQTASTGNAWGVAIDPNPLRDPATPPTMYTPAGYGDLGLWKSTDGGVTWVNLFAGGTGTVPQKGGGTVTFPADKNGIHVDFYQACILPDDPPNHILVTYHYGTATEQALGESTDGGATWEVHNVPWGDSHYVYAIDATTWVLIAGWGGPGTYRTTTAGRVNGVISESAWTNVSTFTHNHGSFTPWFDAKNSDLYFPGGGVFPIQGVQKSHDGGATWTSIYSASPIGMLVATQKTLYASEFGDSTILEAPLSDTSTLAVVTPSPVAAWGGPPPYGVASSFDGQHSIIIAASYDQSDNNGTVIGNGDVWRYVEP